MDKPTCSIDGCETPRGSSRGWCNKHYLRWSRHGTTDLRVHVPVACKVDGCSVTSTSLGMCRIHYNRWKRRGGDLTVIMPTGQTARPPVERFWPKVNKNGPIPDYRPDLGPCWLWTASLRWNGYGHFSTGVGSKSTVAHKFCYELLVGPVPKGMQLDHLCRVRHCLNPQHLEPVTQRTNILRGSGFSARNIVKTHCPQGHEYTADNLKASRKDRVSRQCLTCHRVQERERGRRYRARIKEMRDGEADGGAA